MPRLLLLEDDPVDEELTRMLLTETGVVSQIEVVRKVTTALERLEQGGFDVVLMDLGLPDGGGPKAVQRIVTKAGAIPVIVLTGSVYDEHLIAAALAAGARTCLVKGQVSADEMARVLREATGAQ
jgi:CheY-like chemotaxis protein